MRARVLVTRPEPGASSTARRLAERGFEPILLPLTEIRPLVPHRFPDSAAIDAVAVTSGNAVRHAPPELISVLASKPLYAVGSQTAQAARDSGFATVIESVGEGLSLSSSVLYLCGRVRRDGFEAALVKARLAVDVVETYDTHQLHHASDFVVSLLGNKPVDAALVFSAVAARALLTLARRPGMDRLFARARYFCLSTRTAAVLNCGGAHYVYAASTPNEDSLISLLEREN